MFARLQKQQDNTPVTAVHYFYENQNRLSSETKKQYNNALQAQGYLCNDKGEGYFGSVLLLSPNVILVIGHCFPDGSGYARFQNKIYKVTEFIDGEVDGIGGVDYKLLKPNQDINLQPPRLSTSPTSGECLHIYQAKTYNPSNKRTTIEQYVREYEADDTGPYACRSDIAGINTYPGECCALRFSLSTGAIHAIHQGSSEALLLNTVLLDIEWIMTRERPKQEEAKAALNEITSYVMGWETRYVDNPVYTLSIGHVTPEGPQQQIKAVRGHAYEPPAYPPSTQHFEDGMQALEQIDFDSLWGNNTIADYDSTRIDVQKDAGPFQNIQAQMNGISGNNIKKSFAGVMLDKSFQKITLPSQQACVLNTFKRAMRTAFFEAQNKQIFNFWYVHNTLELNNNNKEQSGLSNSNNASNGNKKAKKGIL